MIHARADSGSYCWEAVEAYGQRGVEFIVSARKTSRLVEELKAVNWRASPRTDANGECEFHYQPEGWGKAYRFIALRYQKQPTTKAAEPEQYQLFDTAVLRDPFCVAALLMNVRERAGHSCVLRRVSIALRHSHLKFTEFLFLLVC